jgi:hypothetical protein
MTGISELVIIILVIVAGVIIFEIWFSASEAVQCTAGVEAVKTWVLKNSYLTKPSKYSPIDLVDIGRPPVSPLCKAVEIKSRDQIIDSQSKNSAKKIIADRMIDCWSAFGNGKIDFMGNTKFFCYPCAIIGFSDKLKQEPNLKIENFNKYLATTYPLGGKESYFQKLGGDPAMAEYGKWDIPANKDLYIYFAAKKGKPFSQVATESAVAGVAAGATVGVVAGYVGASLVCAAAIGAAAATMGAGTPIAITLCSSAAGTTMAIIGGVGTASIVAGSVGGVEQTRSYIQSKEGEKFQQEAGSNLNQGKSNEENKNKYYPVLLIGSIEEINKRCNEEEDNDDSQTQEKPVGIE